MASSSSSLSVQQKFQVFLSFRGEDTRNNFTSHLHEALKRKRIDTFIDYRLVRGEEISPSLLAAIEESKISIIVLSKNYASSSFCLDELSKILECKEKNEQKVVPIFYYIDPSDIRNIRGTFAEAFVEHRKKWSDKAVERWSTHLKKVADLAGYHLDTKKDRLESTVVEEIAQKISKELMCNYSYDTKCLVGIDSHIRKIKSLLCIGSNDVQIIGICGVGGIGKTTIAEVAYDKFSAEFQGRCFLNVGENYGGIRLLRKLLSRVLEDNNLNIETSSIPAPIYDRLQHKKVFIVLDDVNDFENLELFREKHCFGLGSKIIITSREKQVHQQVVDNDKLYEVEGLIDDEALQLFSMYAFKQSHPKEDFMELSNKVVDYAKGLPLALKVLGSTLYGRNKLDWEGDLNILEEIPNPQIDKILKISYNGLNDKQKDIFLDIACFFKGNDRDYITSILGGSMVLGIINVLINKSLITISDNELMMHDLLQQMAWNIVRQESKWPDKRSRLGTPKDICYVFKNNKDAETVEGMILDMSKIDKIRLSSKAFSRMYNLRLLNFYNDHSYPKRERKLYLPHHGLESLPDNLCYLRWDDFPSKSLPSNFCPQNLVELYLRHSNGKRLWRGTQNLVNLKWLDVSFSKHLIELPDLSQAVNLERMALWDCTSLVKVPSCINLRSLKYLNLFGCLKVTKFPEISENLESLYLSKTAIEEVPSSIGCLSKLRDLCLNDCTRLERLPISICKLKSLQGLYLFGCCKLKSFPEILEPMECLKELSLYGTSIEELPSSIENLVGLERLDLNDYEKLKNLISLKIIWKLKSFKKLSVRNCNLFTFPSCVTCLSSLRELDLSENNFETIPASIKQLLELTHLYLRDCKRLQSLPKLPPNLKYLDATSCISLEAVSSSFTIPHITEESETEESETEFIFSDCVKLDQNAINHILTKTREAIHKGCEFILCLPGSEIPEWFNYQSTGSSITIQLVGFAQCAIVGYALCAVVAFEDFAESKCFNVECKVKKDNFGHSADHMLCSSNKLFDSDNVFLLCESCEPFHSNEISFEFFVSHGGYPSQNLGKVKKCGFHLLYAQNDPTSNQSRHDKVPRGNFRSDEVEEEPQPKRLKWNSEC